MARARKAFNAAIPLVAGLLLAILPILLIKGPAVLLPAGRAFVAGALSSNFAVGATLAAATPAIITGLAASLSFRAGHFNLGQTGQYLVGAFAAGVVAPLVPGPALLAILLGILAGLGAGSAWGLLAGGLTYLLRLNVTVVTLMLNYVAEGLVAFLVAGIFLGVDANGIFATTRIPAESRFPPLLERTSLHAGVLVLPVLIIIVYVLVSQSAGGHRLTLYGKNAMFGQLSGTARVPFELRMFVITGALCGLAGAIQVFGIFGRYIDGAIGGPTSAAFLGLTAAILAGSNLLAVVPAGLFLAMLNTGLAGVARDVGISASLSLVIQAALMLAVAVSRRAAPAK